MSETIVTETDIETIRAGVDALVRVSHGMARTKGWYDDGPRNFGELLMLVTSELAEALEEARDGHGMTETYVGKGGKPEGIPIELADAVVRLADLAGANGIVLSDAVVTKLMFNATRPPRHGKRF